MIYKLEYQLEDDPVPHHRYYTALTADTAACMFEATCDDGTLSGYKNITLLSVEPLKKDVPTLTVSEEKES